VSINLEVAIEGTPKRIKVRSEERGNQMIQRYILGIGIALALSACGGSTPQPPTGGGSALSGTVTAPSGSITDTIVVACFVTSATSFDCKNANSKGGKIGGSGLSAQYSIPSMAAGKYVILSAKDVDGDGKTSVGDFSGCYGDDGQGGCKIVQPGATGLDIKLAVVTSVASANKLDIASFNQLLGGAR
jgi:hypothetical protein